MKKKLLFLLFGMSAFSGYSQKVVWEKTIGGEHSEYLFDMVPTVDYGFMLAGSSFSDKSGLKNQTNQGDLDYFVWKMDKNGEEEWQLSFGGSKSDYLMSINQTPDNGYILGGYTESGVGGDKNTVSYGKKDIWIIKLNAKGIQEWQKSFGGIGNDEIVKIKPTRDKGFIIIANSESDKSDNKSENNNGSFDYWIIKLDKNGNKLWDKTIGGVYNDLVKDVIENEDGFLILGNSNSSISGDKKSKEYGGYDNWIVKIDQKGSIADQWVFGGNDDDFAETILSINNKYYIFGTSSSTEGGTIEVGAKNLSDFYMLILDEYFKIINQKYYDFEGKEALKSVHFADNDFFLSGTFTDVETYGNNFLTMRIDTEGTMKEHFILESKSNDILSRTTITREGNLVLGGTSSGKTSKVKSKQIGRNDFWIVKLGEKNKAVTNETVLEAFPNPTDGHTNIVFNHEYKSGEVRVFDLNGRLLFSEKIKYDMIAVDLSSYSSGVYVINVVTDVVNQSVKVIKK